MSERKGFEWWDRLCQLPKFSFVIGTEGGVRRLEDSVGNWIEYAAAQAVVDDAQAEINVLRERLERLAPAAAPLPPSRSGERERAAYFLRRFKSEERMLGPNEQKAIDVALAALAPSPGIDAAEQNSSSNEAWLDHATATLFSVFHMAGDEPFVSAIKGRVVLHTLKTLERDLLENLDEYFTQGDGDYLFSGIWQHADPDVGAPSGYELELIRFTPFEAAPPAAQPSAVDPQFPFYELRFIMRVLSHQGSAPKEDWQTAYGMARDIFVRWSKERQAAEPHPPSRACMCDACKPSFENGADDPAQRHDIVRQVPGPSAEWLAEAERLVGEHVAAIATAAKYCGTPYQTAKHAARAALLAHLRTKPSIEPWCDTMDRPKSKCGCPDCGPSLIDLGPGLRNTPGKP